MEVVYARCAGLDVHQKTGTACRIVPGPDGPPTRAIRTFGTMTDDLEALGDWLTDPAATYHDLGHDYFDRRNRAQLERRLVRRLEGLGFAVDLKKRADAA